MKHTLFHPSELSIELDEGTHAIHAIGEFGPELVGMVDGDAEIGYYDSTKLDPSEDQLILTQLDK
jgi:hypothetical protein